ncbi:MAG: STAS/SEC14 domain-containing protein [Candidatus Binatia bacterium]|nr:STAS/SEC14 domain-containing protein [Candidatus Binatia bacterium]
MLRILPESKGNLVAVQASEKLTAEDYHDTWAPALKAADDKHGSVRALLYADETFKGWEAKALWEDAKLGLTMGTDFDKVAIVGGPQWVDVLVEILGHLIKGAVKTFQSGDLDEAYDWIR